MFRSTPKPGFAVANFTTLISRGTEVVGDVRFKGALEIEGKVFGNLYADDAQAQVRVCESGLVRGEIHVPRVVINGAVEGNVHSSNHVELAAKARVSGDVFYRLVEVVMGAELNGAMHHVPAEEALQKQLPGQVAAAEREGAILD
ncbi:MAG TPA: polymer-forming cytoskeletal protein [Hyphomicrobiales bacterium]|nr:polymer-forming cytoskeletal protein [Hyphomicrobiales bacterium]